MKIKMIRILAIIIIFSNATYSQSFEAFFEQTNEFLQNNVSTDGKIDYARLKRSPGELLYILNNVNDLTLAIAKPNEKIAFYINVYNLNVIKNVVENYPISSVKDIPDFYDKKSNVAGDSLSLTNIEAILKKLTDNQGVNFALSKGRLDSAHLLNAAYLPQTLDYQIGLHVKNEVNKPGFMKINKVDKSVELMNVFYENKAEFVTKYFNEIDFINVFLEKKIDNKLKVYYQKQDLRLNDNK